jgi:hypothetical protein
MQKALESRLGSKRIEGWLDTDFGDVQLPLLPCRTTMLPTLLQLRRRAPVLHALRHAIGRHQRRELPNP